MYFEHIWMNKLLRLLRWSKVLSFVLDACHIMCIYIYISSFSHPRQVWSLKIHQSTKSQKVTDHFPSLEFLGFCVIVFFLFKGLIREQLYLITPYQGLICHGGTLHGGRLADHDGGLRILTSIHVFFMDWFVGNLFSRKRPILDNRKFQF